MHNPENKIKTTIAVIAVCAALGFAPAAHADSVADIHQAAALVHKVMKFASKHQQIDVPVPSPLPDSSGKYVSPYTSTSELTGWAEKALTASAVSAVTGKAADKALGKLGGKLGMVGGLFKNKAKQKSQSAAAAAAVGGWDFVRETSDVSFDRLDDLAVYLHVVHGQDAGFQEALAAAMSVYPSLEKTYQPSIQAAYRAAR